MRKSKPKKRILLPDPKFHDVMVTRFVNDIWRKALENITPQVEVKSRRIGGANFQVPTEVRPERKISLSMKNMIVFARKRSGHSMAEKLCAEIIAAYNCEGAAYKRKEDMHRMAEANKAFAHFRF